MKYKGNKDNNKEWLGLKGRGLKGGFSDIEVDDEEGEEEEEEEEEKRYFQIPPRPGRGYFQIPPRPGRGFFQIPPAGDFFHRVAFFLKISLGLGIYSLENTFSLNEDIFNKDNFPPAGGIFLREAFFLKDFPRSGDIFHREHFFPQWGYFQ